jgi:hypothetical protein
MIMTALRKTGILELYKQKWPAGQTEVEEGAVEIPEVEEAHLLHMGLEWLRDIHRIHYTPTLKFTYFTWCAILLQAWANVRHLR